MRFRSLVGHYNVDETGRQVEKPTYLIQWQDDRRRIVLPPEVADSEIRRVTP